MPAIKTSQAAHALALIRSSRYSLVGVPSKPSRLRLPIRERRVFIADRHFDLRQTLGVEYLVFRDHLVDEEQIRRQRVDLIGGQRPLFIERHAAIDEVPDRGRERRADRKYSAAVPGLNIWTRWF